MNRPGVTKRSRYNHLSNLPREFDGVMTLIASEAAKTQGCFHEGLREIRIVICRNRAWKDKQEDAGAFARFLINVGVLLKSGSGLYFDEDRLVQVNDAIAQKIDLAPVVDAEQRIATIRAKYASPVSASGASSPDALPSTQIAPDTAFPTVQEELGASLELPGPGACAIIASTGIRNGLKDFVLYLTPLERSIWEDLVLRADAKDDAVEVPTFERGFGTSWGPPGGCAWDDFVSTLGRFVSCGLLIYVGKGRDPFEDMLRFKKPPSVFEIVEIPERVEKPVPQVYIDIVRALQSGAFQDIKHGRTVRFDEWVSRTFEGVNPPTVSRRMFTRVDANHGWGIQFTGHGVVRVCWPGFEPYVFVSTQKPPRKWSTTRTATPVTPDPASSPVEALPTDLSAIETEEAELLRRLAEVKERKQAAQQVVRQGLQVALTMAQVHRTQLLDQVAKVDEEIARITGQLTALSNG